jgi:hypothetical protein
MDLGIVNAASICGAWGALFLCIAISAVVRPEWRWRKGFRRYLLVSFLFASSVAILHGSARAVVGLAIGHLLPHWLAGRELRQADAPVPAWLAQHRATEGQRAGLSRSEFVGRGLRFVLGLVALACVPGVFSLLSERWGARGGVHERAAAPQDLPTAPRVVDTVEPSPASSLGDDAGATTKAIGVGYRIDGKVFVSAMSGLRVQLPPGFSYVRREALAVGVIGPEVVVTGPEGSGLSVIVESIVAPSAESGLRMLRTIADGARKLANATLDEGDPWRSTVLGETRLFVGSRADGVVTRDTYFWAKGRAYRFSIETQQDSAKMLALADEVLGSVSWLPSSARERLRSELRPNEVTQAQMGSDSVVRGQVFRSFRHGLSWTAPPGLWRFVSEEVARGLYGSGVVFVAADEESGLNVTLSVVMAPNVGAQRGYSGVARSSVRGSGRAGLGGRDQARDVVCDRSNHA